MRVIEHSSDGIDSVRWIVGRYPLPTHALQCLLARELGNQFMIGDIVGKPMPAIAPSVLNVKFVKLFRGGHYMNRLAPKTLRRRFIEALGHAIHVFSLPWAC
jgi:hypothetical protein